MIGHIYRGHIVLQDVLLRLLLLLLLLEMPGAAVLRHPIRHSLLRRGRVIRLMVVAVGRRPDDPRLPLFGSEMLSIGIHRRHVLVRVRVGMLMWERSDRRQACRQARQTRQGRRLCRSAWTAAHEVDTACRTRTETDAETRIGVLSRGETCRRDIGRRRE